MPFVKEPALFAPAYRARCVKCGGGSEMMYTTIAVAVRDLTRLGWKIIGTPNKNGVMKYRANSKAVCNWCEKYK